MDIVDRIKKIIEYKNISTRKFCIEIGVANGFFDKVKDVGSKKILKILYKYPEINPEWLLTGAGEMLRSGQSETVASGDSSGAGVEEINVYKEINRELRKEIGELNRRIGELNYEARVLRGEVEKLSERLKGGDGGGTGERA